MYEIILFVKDVMSLTWSPLIYCLNWANYKLKFNLDIVISYMEANFR